LEEPFFLREKRLGKKMGKKSSASRCGYIHHSLFPRFCGGFMVMQVASFFATEGGGCLGSAAWRFCGWLFCFWHFLIHALESLL